MQQDIIYTEQGIFDAIVAHLRKQWAQSVTEGGQCRYRGPEGLMCAVGILLTDSEARVCEGLDVLSLLDQDALPERLVPFADLLTSLQNTHDSWPIYQWERRFAEVAERRNLVLAPK